MTYDTQIEFVEVHRENLLWEISKIHKIIKIGSAVWSLQIFKIGQKSIVLLNNFGRTA